MSIVIYDGPHRTLFNNRSSVGEWPFTKNEKGEWINKDGNVCVIIPLGEFLKSKALDAASEQVIRVPKYDFADHEKQKWFDELRALNKDAKFEECGE